MTAVPTATRDLVGAVLSRRWRLVKKLGDGGMGEVYAAEPIEGGAKVAVKILIPDFLAEPSVVQRFADEARTTQRLIHPNIVRVFESQVAEDGSPYIVMELLEGVPLSAYTQNGGRVALAQAVPILNGILAGLAAAHAQNIVHRDLKPENVFLTRDAANHFVVKVLDFGIAKVMDAAGGMGSKTRTGMLLGTPAYMSPEQIKNAKDVDARADLWSAGVMFYEMITGRVAFAAPTEYARLSAVLTTNPEPVERVDPQLSPVSAFVQRALQKDRNARFQSALETARALSAAAAGTDGVASRVLEQPLSRLPEMPFAPSVLTPATPMAASAPSTQPATAPDTLNRIPTKTPGGTLASPSTPGFISEPPPPPQVILVQNPPHQDGTLPSKDLPMLPPTKSGVPRIGVGVPIGVVVALVAGALVAGLLIGFAVAKLI